jgi:hypothetical protein
MFPLGCIALLMTFSFADVPQEKNKKRGARAWLGLIGFRT